MYFEIQELSLFYLTLPRDRKKMLTEN
jgi:hypothetical protein